MLHGATHMQRLAGVVDSAGRHLQEALLLLRDKGGLQGRAAPRSCPGPSWAVHALLPRTASVSSSRTCACTPARCSQLLQPQLMPLLPLLLPLLPLLPLRVLLLRMLQHLVQYGLQQQRLAAYVHQAWGVLLLQRELLIHCGGDEAAEADAQLSGGGQGAAPGVWYQVCGGRGEVWVCCECVVGWVVCVK